MRPKPFLDPKVSKPSRLYFNRIRCPQNFVLWIDVTLDCWVSGFAELIGGRLRIDGLSVFRFFLEFRVFESRVFESRV